MQKIPRTKTKMKTNKLKNIVTDAKVAAATVALLNITSQINAQSGGGNPACSTLNCGPFEMCCSGTVSSGPGFQIGIAWCCSTNGYCGQPSMSNGKWVGTCTN
jgi:hypothetical protein